MARAGHAHVRAAPCARGCVRQHRRPAARPRNPTHSYDGSPRRRCPRCRSRCWRPLRLAHQHGALAPGGTRLATYGMLCQQSAAHMADHQTLITAHQTYGAAAFACVYEDTRTMTLTYPLPNRSAHGKYRRTRRRRLAAGWQRTGVERVMSKTLPYPCRLPTWRCLCACALHSVVRSAAPPCAALPSSAAAWRPHALPGGAVSSHDRGRHAARAPLPCRASCAPLGAGARPCLCRAAPLSGPRSRCRCRVRAQPGLRGVCGPRRRQDGQRSRRGGRLARPGRRSLRSGALPCGEVCGRHGAEAGPAGVGLLRGAPARRPHRGHNGTVGRPLLQGGVWPCTAICGSVTVGRVRLQPARRPCGPAARQGRRHGCGAARRLRLRRIGRGRIARGVRRRGSARGICYAQAHG